MNSLVLISLAAIASVAIAADDASSAKRAASPVLRTFEPAESGVFRLPGAAAPATPPAMLAAPPATSIIAKDLAIAAVGTASPPPAKPAMASIAPIPALPKTVEDPAKPALPAGVVQEIAFYCQRFIGQWKEADARKILGAPVRNRPAYDESKVRNGKIYAFQDPTGRYRELELDFEANTGTLRTVFVYPPRLSWQEVRRRWTGEVNGADAREGRKFYSYANRRMNVLVDAEGRVISLGLY